mgnify:CR=1 FL=1
MTCYTYGRGRNLPVIVWIRGTKVNSYSTYYSASIWFTVFAMVIMLVAVGINRAQLPWLPDVSTGYAVFDTSEEELGSAVERADAAMYRVKNEKKAAARS